MTGFFWSLKIGNIFENRHLFPDLEDFRIIALWAKVLEHLGIL